ncbi:hypothetical protein [Parasphingorhabdus sp.]|uniref:hypothetical protein n=1 Tax=Parasphingorhabdus sp. TaxID=2709688 RepID=UPI003593979D
MIDKTTASPKLAVGAVLGAVTNAATSVSNIFDTASTGFGMMNRYVQSAAEKQASVIDYEMADYEEQLLITVSVERTRANREIQRFLDEDPANKAEFDTVYSNLQAAVQARRDERAGIKPTRKAA